MAEHGHGPAAPPGQGGHGVHVDRVHVRPLLAVDLDVHEAGVHLGGDLRVLERLVGHDVAPVAGRIADREENGNVALGGRCPSCFAPRIPVHRVVGVLTKVRAALVGQKVHRSDPTDEPLTFWNRPTGRLWG